jgi:dTDP-4-dehydrorhamnose reductase
LFSFVGSLPSLDVVVHTAAATDVNRCEKEPGWCVGVNVEGTRNVRDAAASKGARLIHLSTFSVFSGERGDYRENDALDPRNRYNESKAEGERVVSEYDRSLILRLNVIGIHPEGSRGKNFFEWLVDSVRGNKDMNLFTDIRINPLSNWTLAETIRDLIVRWPGVPVLHLGSRTVLSKAEIGRMVVANFPAYTGTVREVSSDTLSAVAFRPKEGWLNVEKAQALGFAMPTLEDEVVRLLKRMNHDAGNMYE